MVTWGAEWVALSTQPVLTATVYITTGQELS